MSKIKINKTPRPYLSWSQLSLLEKSEYEYVKCYIYGEGTPVNPLLCLGKELAEALEFDLENIPEDIEIARILIPKFEKKEFKLEGRVDDIPIVGILDGFDEKDLVIHEIKTGTYNYQQKDADKHGQLTFYSLLVYLNYGKLPNKIYLYHIPSRFEDGNFKLKSEIRIFETKRTMKDILDITKRIKRAWKRIQELYESEIQNGNVK